MQIAMGLSSQESRERIAGSEATALQAYQERTFAERVKNAELNAGMKNMDLKMKNHFDEKYGVLGDTPPAGAEDKKKGEEGLVYYQPPLPTGDEPQRKGRWVSEEKFKQLKSIDYFEEGKLQYRNINKGLSSPDAASPTITTDDYTAWKGIFP